MGTKKPVSIAVDSLAQNTFAALEKDQLAQPGLEWFQFAMEALSDGVWDWDLSSGKSYCSTAYFHMLGLEPSQATSDYKSWLDLVHPDDRRAAWEANQACIEGITQEFEVEFRMRHRDGSWRWIKSRGKCAVRGADGRALHLIGTHTDITGARRAQQTQAALYQISEAAHSVADLDELYRRIHAIIGGLINADNFYIALYDEDTGLLSFPYFIDEFDIAPPPKKPERGLTEYVLRSGQPLLTSPEVYRRLVDTGAIEAVGAPSIDWLGAPLKVKEQTIGVMALQTYTPEVRYTPSDQDMLGFISTQVASAIQSKRAEEQIRKLNSTLHSISQVSQILVRAADEGELMRRVCQALVETGNFPLVWIGLYEKDHTICPAVISGNDGGILKHARLTWGNISPSKRNTRSLARAGAPDLRRHLVSAGVRSDEDALALTCGYSSSLRLPLVAGGQPFGAAYIYAIAPDAFREEEVAVLSQLADNLAYGVAALRERAQHEEAEKALRESEEKYRNVVERANDGIAILQGQKVTYANQRLAEMWGGPVEEIIGRPFTDFILPSAIPDVLDKFRRRQAGEPAPGSYTTRLQRRDGVPVEAELNTGLLSIQGVTSEMVIVRDITEHKQAEQERLQRLAELEATNRISAALRSVQNLEEMLSLLLDETLEVMNSSVGAIWLYDPPTGELLSVAALGWFERIARFPQKKGEGIGTKVLETGKVYLTQDFSTDPDTFESVRELIPRGEGGVCVPIYSSTERVGVFYLSVTAPRALSTGEVRLLVSLAEIAGSAIHRMRLHAQVELHVQRLNAMRLVDNAITSSLDLNLTLNVLLEQVTSQLGVDAADVLLLNPQTHTLDYAAGKGFLTSAALRPPVRLGEGLAGRAAREQKMVSAANPSQTSGSGAQGWLAQKEHFKTYYAMPLISKGNIAGVLELYHHEPLSPDAEWLEFFETIAGQAAIAIEDARLFQSLQRSNAELTLAYDLFIEGLSRTLELRHHETQGHSQRVTALTLALAREMGITNEEELTALRRGALLHDIGKICVPDSILLKPGKLDAAEWSVMRKHPDYANDMLAPIGFLGAAVEIPYCHHERWDGGGYPRGLAGKEIPLSARIFAVVDVWDALTNNRVYQKAWSREEARAYIAQNSGAHFDPQVVKAFLSLLDAGALAGQGLPQGIQAARGVKDT